jgi:flagellar biosynthesis GTPase FlhF
MDLALREALISCLLHLRQHIDAASFFLACLQTGASVASAVVFELFNAIAKTPDARSAVRLVRGLSVRANKFGEFLRSMPEDIRGCVCRRLDYLLHIINLRRLDVQFVDETIYDLGMRRRHLERLIDVLEEHGYTNEAMNMGRSTFNLLEEGTRAVAISRPKALSLGSARMTATTKQFHLKGAIAQWAPDVDSEQAAKRIHARMRETVQAEVERQIRDHAQDAVRLRVQAHLRKHLQDQDAEEPAQVQSSEDHSPEDDSLRRHIEESIEETIRLEVHRQVEEQLRAVKEGQNASRDQADSALGPWFGDSPEAADEWFSHRRHLQQVGTGS